MAEEKNIAQEVQEVLTQNSEEIVFEEIQNENSSPLNQPVVEKDIGGETPVDNQVPNNSWNVWKPENDTDTPDDTKATTSTDTDFRNEAKTRIEKEKQQEPLDAPEQEINGGENAENEIDEESVESNDYEIPLTQANQAATAILGITNNVIAAGSGYFVKIKKHKDFYEYEEVIQVIDEQNEKNKERVLLDKEDKALLQPLLAQVLRKKAKKLTPEQQLMGAVASILLKKGQVVMEVRAENSLLEERILDIVGQEKEHDNIEAVDEYVMGEKEETTTETSEKDETYQEEVENHEPDISVIEYAEVTKKDS